MNRFWLSQGAHTAWDSSAETPHTSLNNFTKKSRLSPLYPNDPPLMTFISSNLKNEQILFFCVLMLGGVILVPTNFSSFLVIFYYIFFSV
jgi:hypothetical protein